MFEFVRVTCPYCFENVEMELDPETVGELVHDCEVCCNPWRVFVRRTSKGKPIVDVDRAQ
ncbi:MAG TPA: CPXCG motif-containing cysteine-rich protein [Myxococcota bacterium]